MTKLTPCIQIIIMIQSLYRVLHLDIFIKYIVADQSLTPNVMSNK